MSFKFDFNGNEIIIDDISQKVDKWVVKESEVYTYSKSDVITEAFIKDFPHISLLGKNNDEKFEYISRLVSRSKSLNVWFSMKKLEYSELAQLPKYLTDLIKPKEFKAIQNDISRVNRVVSDYTEARVEINKQYKRTIEANIDSMNDEINKIIKSNPVTKILTLTTQSLPLSMIANIEEFNTKTSDTNFEEKKSLYAKEMLTQFKISLLKLIKENPYIDIDQVIDHLKLK